MVTIERLRETEIFHSLSDEELGMVSAVCQSRAYDSGSIICREGEESTDIYLVDDGAVNCEIEPLPNQHVGVCTRTKNCVFGWSALLPPHRYTATARTTQKTKVIVANGGQLRKICETHPQICSVVMEHIVRVVDIQLRDTRQALLQCIHDPTKTS